MNDRSGAETDEGSGRMLSWAIRTAGLAGLIGLAATHYLARGQNGRPDALRVAQAVAGRPAVDPETTGSIAQGARIVRLDPCNTASGARAKRP